MSSFVSIGLAIFAFILLGTPVVSRAQPIEDRQEQRVDAVIQPDWSVKGRWTIPVSTSETDIYIFPEYKEFGFTAAFSYTLTGAANENGPVTFSREAGDYAYVNTGYQSGSIYRKLFIDYSFKPPFKSPFVIYEFQVFGGGYFFSPKLRIQYPENLTLLTSWPPAEKTKPVEIVYPTENSYVYPVVLLFKPNPLPPGVVIEKEGIFTVAGDSVSVRSITSAAAGLGELREVVQDLLDAPLPQEVFIMIADLDPIKLSSEPSGLAIRPNIILLNKAFIARQERVDLQVLLAHETAHLVEMNKSLFRGASFIAPWFREGIATAVEIEMLNRLLKTSEERARYATLGTYSSHLFSAEELQNKYKKPFDYLLNGANYHPTTASYAHGAVVLRRLYQAKGASGMKQLYSRLRTADSSQLCEKCDSETIIHAVSAIGGWSADDVLFPYQGMSDFDDKAGSLLAEKIDETREDQLIIQYIAQKVPKYFTENGADPNPKAPAKNEASKQPAAPVVAAPPVAVPVAVPSQKKSSADIQKVLDTGKKDVQVMTPQKTVPAAPAKSATETPSIKAIPAKAAPASKAPEKKKPSIIQKLKNLFKKNK